MNSDETGAAVHSGRSPHDSESQIAGYRTEAVLGEDRSGQLYRARKLDSVGARDVALSVVHSECCAEPQTRERFLAQARALSKVTHPSVCRILDYGCDGRMAFVATDLLHGEPLSRLLATGRRRASSPSGVRGAAIVARVCAQLAEAVFAADQVRTAAGIPRERGLSLRRLYVLDDGTARFADFEFPADGSRVSSTGDTIELEAVGYMAPERLLSRGADARADVWTLGVIFWELVTGRAPFRRKNEVLTMRAILEEPIPLEDVERQFGRELRLLIEGAVCRDLERRHPTALAFAQALEQWLTVTGALVAPRAVADWLSEKRLGLPFAHSHSSFPVAWAKTVRRSDGKGQHPAASEATEPHLPVHRLVPRAPSSDFRLWALVVGITALLAGAVGAHVYKRIGSHPSGDVGWASGDRRDVR